MDVLIALDNLREFDFSAHLVLLHLVLELLLALLGLIKSDFLLQGAVFHLLILQEESLDLSLELLENHLVVLNDHLQVILRLVELLVLLLLLLSLLRLV